MSISDHWSLTRVHCMHCYLIGIYCQPCDQPMHCPPAKTVISEDIKILNPSVRLCKQSGKGEIIGNSYFQIKKWSGFLWLLSLCLWPWKPQWVGGRSIINFLAVEFSPNEWISLIYLGVQCLAFALFLPQMDRDCLDDCSLTQSHYHSLHNQTFW